MSIERSDLQLQADGKTAHAYLATPGDSGPGVLVLHAWWGLNLFFKQVCDMLAENGFMALAPDLYQGRLAGTIDEAKELLDKREVEYMENVIKAAKNRLASLTGGRLGVVGFSMGAAWALETAAHEPDIAATVLFYGVNSVDFAQVKAKVLGQFAEADEWEPLEGVREMEADMKAAGLDVTIHTYPGAGHWFVEEDRPEYNRAAAELAWERTVAFLRRNLKGRLVA